MESAGAQAWIHNSSTHDWRFTLHALRLKLVRERQALKSVLILSGDSGSQIVTAGAVLGRLEQQLKLLPTGDKRAGKQTAPCALALDSPLATCLNKILRMNHST